MLKEFSLEQIADKKKRFPIVDGPFGTQLHADEYVDIGIPVVRIVNLSFSGKFDEKDLVYITEEKFKKLKRSEVVQEDIIIAKTGATIGKSAKYPFEKGLIASSCLKISVDKQIVDPTYLLYLITSHEGQKNIIEGATGSTRTTINNGPFQRIKFKFHSKSDQTRIAEILSSVDKAISDTKALIAKYQCIKTGLMQDLLTLGIDKQGNIRSKATHRFEIKNGVEVPEEWDVGTVEDVLSSIEQGWSPDCDSNPAPTNEWGVLKTTAVTWDGYNENENKRLPKKLTARSQYEIKSGDVLITRAGPNSRVGVVAYVKKTRPKLILSDKLYRLVTNERVTGEFLMLALASFQMQKQLSNLKTGMAESQTNISQKMVCSLKVVIPEIEEQKQIIDRLNSIDHILIDYNKTKSKMQKTKDGLMQDLLTGKVQVLGKK